MYNVVAVHIHELTHHRGDLFIIQHNAWNVDKFKVHAVVRDNARNITKVMEVSDIASLPCVAHTLQLAVNVNGAYLTW